MFKGSIVALITPFNNKGNVDLGFLKELILWHVKCKTDGIVLCGTTGESPTLSDQEKIQIFRAVTKVGKGKIQIIAGTGSYSTQKTILLTQKAKDIGVDGALVVVPYYNKPSLSGIIKHYEEISKIKLPLILYHHPKRTGTQISIEALLNMQKMPYISAIKEASGDLEFNLKLLEKSTKNILSGDDALIVSVMKKGAKGSISVLANIIPCQWKEITKLCFENRFDEANKKINFYKPLIEAMFLESNPICVKYALSLMKKCLNIIRLPLMKPSFANQRKIKKVLIEYSLM